MGFDMTYGLVMMTQIYQEKILLVVMYVKNDLDKKLMSC